MFKALVIEEAPKRPSVSVKQLDENQLPDGDVTVSVQYSSMNYKDGMAIRGLGKLVREYPHVPGVDFVGVVEESSHSTWSVGDEVLLTGHLVGEHRWGGFAQKARVNGDWLVALPDGLESKRAMAIGTAGLAAMISVLALESHAISPDTGPILVTGASGGVGSLAVMILAHRGYEVHASTGDAESHDYLMQLGASQILERSDLAMPPHKPLDTKTWAGAIDNVGGSTLAHILAHIQTRGSVAAVGLTGGSKLETSLLPFLLRGVNLLGIATADCPRPRRTLAWERLSQDIAMDKLDALMQVHGLDEAEKLADRILAGDVRGRVVIDVNA